MAETCGSLIVVSGPSGCGKTSLCAALLQRCLNLKLSVSATSRPPRPGETDGLHYHFLDLPSFEQQVRDGAFLEHALVHGNGYGTRLGDVDAMLADGFDVLLEIDWQGASQVGLLRPQACRIFILPPSIEELRRRLSSRGQDDASVIERRVAAAESEIAHAGEAGFRIINDDFDTALAELQAIYLAHSVAR
ncbi:MAG: guanylate kinase [Zetaproteobacteria bacterium CG_4_8_14_3_um_filter_59_5]|nr:MAG: guanylate kinase [Zetaproteobacteria bacterium CG_4_8_14_3_um_filter_59_5]HCS13291.1 guanylate kinase [Zetaproteobacteria bacterium]